MMGPGCTLPGYPQPQEGLVVGWNRMQLQSHSAKITQVPQNQILKTDDPDGLFHFFKTPRVSQG
ncbi:hypothetical protein ANO14919_128190 [Xylariales sp. No.14919]|nr:hypothetical protein ANO14919_128190 [Xylariales sp. No.14919]